MKKVLTISIAAYNVEKYINRTLDSLVFDGNEALEVLIINDGSSDNTEAIARRYELNYPSIFRVVNKKNGGYGSTINTGIIEASGKYFKQLDGDDALVTENVKALCTELEKTEAEVICTPYIELNIKSGQKNIQNADFFREYSGKEIMVDTVSANSYQVLKMHTLAYKTVFLRNSKIKIDENCFYTDVEYVLYPCINAHTMKILNLPIYLYSIGDDSQSMSKTGMIKHFDDHTTMSNHIAQALSSISTKASPVLRRYVVNVLLYDILQFKLDILPLKWKSYSIVKERQLYFKENYDKIYSDMFNISNAIKALDWFGFLGYCVVKIARFIKAEILNE